MDKNIKRISGFVIIALLLIGWGVLMYFYPPEVVVSYLGVSNSYLVLFLIAVFGGASSFTSTAFYASIVTFSLAGLNMLLIGFIGGLGISIGDSLFFYLGRKGKSVFSKKHNKNIEKARRWLDDKPRWLVPVIGYFWAGFSPFPNDIYTISVGVLDYEYWKIIIPVFLGNISFLLIVSYLSIKGISLF